MTSGTPFLAVKCTSAHARILAHFQEGARFSARPLLGFSVVVGVFRILARCGDEFIRLHTHLLWFSIQLPSVLHSMGLIVWSMYVGRESQYSSETAVDTLQTLHTRTYTDSAGTGW